jgi:hypothetical protein
VKKEGLFDDPALIGAVGAWNSRRQLPNSFTNNNYPMVSQVSESLLCGEKLFYSITKKEELRLIDSGESHALLLMWR